jgi:hypothetical protein
VALSTALLGASCSNDDNGTATTDTSAPGTSVSSTPGDTTTKGTDATGDGNKGGIDTMPDANTDTKTAPYGGDASTGIPLLQAVRVARQEGFDRVTFEFAGPNVPGYEIGYTERPITEDGSGNEVTVQGDHVVKVRFEPASGVDLTGATMQEIYTGPTVVTGDTSTVNEVVRTGDFEAVLSWAVGLADKVDFRVSTLESPSRVVIDFRNH